MRPIIISGPSGSIHCGGGDAQCFTTYENFGEVGCCFMSPLKHPSNTRLEIPINQLIFFWKLFVMHVLLLADQQGSNIPTFDPISA